VRVSSWFLSVWTAPAQGKSISPQAQHTKTE
jgi:hypothetical protein